MIDIEKLNESIDEVIKRHALGVEASARMSGSLELHIRLAGGCRMTSGIVTYEYTTNADVLPWCVETLLMAVLAWYASATGKAASAIWTPPKLSRLDIAAMAMQGLLAGPGIQHEAGEARWTSHEAGEIEREAFLHADALIAVSKVTP